MLSLIHISRPKESLEELPLPELESDARDYYRNFRDADEGKAPLAVTPEQAPVSYTHLSPITVLRLLCLTQQIRPRPNQNRRQLTFPLLQSYNETGESERRSRVSPGVSHTFPTHDYIHRQHKKERI